MRWVDIEVPNSTVDMNSWVESACYPRSTFYPLSDGASTCNRQITKTYFRTCSTCLSRSQALLCLYTYTMISIHRKRTFARLRYYLGGDRPSQTAHQTLSKCQIHGIREKFNLIRVVFHQWLHISWRLCFKVSHLSYTYQAKFQYQAAVKVHGVFSSHYW